MNRKFTSAELKSMAKEMLLGRYALLIAVYFVSQLLLTTPLYFVQFQVNMETTPGLIIYYAVYFILLLLGSLIAVGQNHIYLNISRGLPYQFSDLWYGFTLRPDKTIVIFLMLLGLELIPAIPVLATVAIMIVTKIYMLSILIALFYILFFVAIILITLNYALVFFLILDHPDDSVVELLRRSRMLMKGNKGRYFYMILSFIGLFLLGILTCGIGMLWIVPYTRMTFAGFYRNVIGEI